MNTYKDYLHELKGKTIAVVYIFEGEDAPGSQHYWVWKSDIISGWLLAIQELECVPYIMDVRTFIHKAISKTLPHIDYVINLNCGSYELSTMSLIPSMCSFLSVPCIPCNAIAIVMSENKKISNILANSAELRVPRNLQSQDTNGIFRPLNLGSSLGVQVGKYAETNYDGLYQEFIPGYDVTFPILYNPLYDKIDLLPPLVYIPKTKNPKWIYDIDEKYSETEGFIKLPLLYIDNSVREKLLDFAKTFPITTYARIDARIKCIDKELSLDITQKTFTLDDLYFVEINSMPTIEKEDSFEMSYKIAKETKSHSFYECINKYCKLIKNPTMIGFVLSSSIISFSKAKFQDQKD